VELILGKGKEILPYCSFKSFVKFKRFIHRDALHVIILHHFRLTKCTFHKFGASGELEKHDALCILPLNIFNEKIYIFLWFWMLSLTALTSIVVFYRCGQK
jgi:hypothetical protein